MYVMTVEVQVVGNNNKKVQTREVEEQVPDMKKQSYLFTKDAAVKLIANGLIIISLLVCSTGNGQ